MANIYVRTPFKLQHRGDNHDFAVGNHDVPAEVAEHWYVQAHIGAAPAADPEAGAAADAMLADLEAKEKALAARADDLDAYAQALAGREAAVERRESAAAEQDVALDARQAALDSREQALAEQEQSQQNAGGDDAKGKDDAKTSAKGK